MSVRALRITPTSTTRKVRTKVVMAKAMMAELAATPSSFQPIHFLKPRPSAVSSRCIHPPGGAALKVGDRRKPWLDDGRSFSGRSSFKPKSGACAVLDKIGFEPTAGSCHMPYTYQLVLTASDSSQS